MHAWELNGWLACGWAWGRVSKLLLASFRFVLHISVLGILHSTLPMASDLEAWKD